jgi:large subunit ribosomal protein L10
METIVTQADSHEAAEPIVWSVPQRELTTHGNVDPPHRQYLFATYYKLMFGNRLVLFIQHNNLTVSEQENLRRQLCKHDASMKIIRIHIFNAMLRRSAAYMGVSSLLVGPTCIVTSNASDEKDPQLLANVLSMIRKNRKLLLLGGKLDSDLLDYEGLENAARLPPLHQLRAELIGLLNAPASHVITTLSRNSKDLVFTLMVHRKNLCGDDNS